MEQLTVKGRERKLNPPYRWNAPALTKLELSAFRVVDTETHMRIELITPANQGERIVQSIDIPFMPTAMHSDCISLKAHELTMAQKIKEAVGKATAEANARAEAAEGRMKIAEAQLENALDNAGKALAGYDTEVKRLSTETEIARQHSAASAKLVQCAQELDRLELLFRMRPAFAHQLRTLVKAYVKDRPIEYVTKTDHKVALAQQADEKKRAVDQAVFDTVEKFKHVLETCSKALSDADKVSVLRLIEETLASYDKI
jgi:hypothetical protein